MQKRIYPQQDKPEKRINNRQTDGQKITALHPCRNENRHDCESCQEADLQAFSEKEDDIAETRRNAAEEAS